MLRRRTNHDVQRRVEERRQREEEAGRLRDEVPELLSLRLEIDETQGNVPLTAARYIRHVVVDQAPALFEVPCTDQHCRDGGHDLTSPILQALRAERREFDGEDACYGQIGRVSCGRILRYVAHATYRESSKDE